MDKDILNLVQEIEKKSERLSKKDLVKLIKALSKLVGVLIANHSQKVATLLPFLHGLQQSSDCLKDYFRLAL